MALKKLLSTWPRAVVIAAATTVVTGCAGNDVASLVAGDPKLVAAGHSGHSETTVHSKAVQQSSVAVPVTAGEPSGPPASASTRMAAGLKALERGDPATAEQLLRAGADGSADWRTLSALGIATSMLGRQAEAQTYLKKALKTSPNNPTLLNNLAISYMLERKPAEAEIVLQRISASGAASRETIDNLALAKALKAQISNATTSPASE